MKYHKYQKDSEYSYSLGTYATLELLKYRPLEVLEVVLSSNNHQQESVEQILLLCQQHNIPVSVNDKQIERISVKENCYAIGFFRKYDTVITKGDHIVLYQISDMGNLGTIARGMRGFGYQDLVLIKPAADILDPKVVRASMGAVFQVNFKYFDSFEAYTAAYKNQVLMFAGSAAKFVEDQQLESPYSLMFGNEAAGLPSTILAQGLPVKLHQSKDIDSLNLGVAANIGMYLTMFHKGV